MDDINLICEYFAKILNGKSSINHGVCSVSLQRNFKVMVQGHESRSVVPAGVSFESLDASGNALCLAEIAILEEEIPRFMHSVLQQGLIVSALHNHWLYTKPSIMYFHIQSVEPPLNFARKMVYSFSFLSSFPIST